VYCHKEAEYMLYGKTLCAEHFRSEEERLSITIKPRRHEKKKPIKEILQIISWFGLGFIIAYPLNLLIDYVTHTSGAFPPYYLAIAGSIMLAPSTVAYWLLGRRKK